jgi:hypothetical protein
MITKAYFINPTGKILDIDMDRHIMVIRQNPEKFGLTGEEIKELFDKYGERPNQEGKAREEIIHKLIKNGFVHIRQYRNFWAVNFWQLTSKIKKALSTWAEHLIDKKIDRYGDCRLFALKTNTILGTVSVQDLYYEQFNENTKMTKKEELDYQPMIVESIHDFEDLIQTKESLLSFKDFFINESSLSRVWKHMKDHDYGTITAFRGNYTHKENMQRNKSLVSKIMAKGYSVTAIDGGYVENWDDDEVENKDVTENSYLVVDIKDKGTLEKDLRKWGEEFEQDSILFGKANEKPALIGTSKRQGQKLSYGKKIMNFDAVKYGYKGQFFSQVNDRPFIFESIIHEFTIPKYPSEFRSVQIEADKTWKEIQLDDEEKNSGWY